MTAIIVLNWNGWEDTLECLDSLSNCKGEFFTIVIDNGSCDGSIEHIANHLAKNNQSHNVIDRNDILPSMPKSGETIIVRMGENLGFAKGNNEGLRMIAHFNIDYFLLLNNDTIVEPDFLQNIERFSEEHQDYSVLSPIICYNYDRNIIWNCGGKQKWGLRKYYYANKNVSCIKENGHIDISFVTGCALFFKPELLNKENRLLTEDYFFGEEDFNFCIQMKKQGRKMACVLSSKIYHKVGASTKEKVPTGKIYIYYLNRFIDIRKSYGVLFFGAWAIVNIIYITQLLHSKIGYTQAIKLVADVFKTSLHKNTVTQSDFLNSIDRYR